MSKKFWVVQQLNWHVYGRHCQDHEEDNGLPVGVFASQKKAEAFCQALEEQARRELSPVQFFDELEQASNLDEEVIVERLQSLGLQAPASYEKKSSRRTYTRLDWNGWWDQCSPDLTEEQRVAIWQLFSRLQFYKVVATEEESE